MTKRKIIVEIICLLFMILFVYTGVSKLMDFQKFSVELGKSPLLTAFAWWVAWIIPAVEITVSIMLIIGRLRLIALYLSFGLMVTFTAYIEAILQFSDYIPCSCGGVIQNMNWDQHLVFNIFFILISIVGILLYEPDTKAIDIEPSIA